MKLETKRAEETKELGAKFTRSLKPKKEEATVICLLGDLGAGKTTFVQGVASALFIKETIQSPTFVLMKRFSINPPFRSLIHVDAYRIEDESELKQLNFEEILSDPTNLVFIEWPERIKNSIPKTAETISFRFIDDSTREIIVPDYADKK